jgi:16S rRNA (uracil1498-N3)-methyltransferase
MDSLSRCVNNGGDASLVRLDEFPVLETETPLSPAALAALESWQARPGEVLTVVDPDLTGYRARVVSLEPEAPLCVPFASLDAPPESVLRITLFQALPEKERFELVLQKATELGAARLVPLQTRHSATQDEHDTPQRKSHRWPELVSRAARQCRRAMLPQLLAVTPFEEALALAVDCELKLMLYEGHTAWTVAEAVGQFNAQSVALLVGPEGGFAVAEVEQAQAAGFVPVSLGPRILRTETAAIVGIALLQSLLGDLGQG